MEGNKRMASEENDDKTLHRVLVNEEEQYSLWPKDNAIPNGWKSVKEGTRAAGRVGWPSTRVR